MLPVTAVHPALAHLLRGDGETPPADIDAARARRRALAEQRGGPLLPVAAVRPVSDGAVHLRCYEPLQRESSEVVVIVHGGGWVWGGLDEVEPLARAVAAAAHRTTVAVRYRLAPEHRSPAALDDVASHTPEDAETRRLLLDVVVRRNGREPRTVHLASKVR